LTLAGRLLLALLFLPAGLMKIGGFAGTVGYIGSMGLPLPTLGADPRDRGRGAAAAWRLLAGFGTRAGGIGAGRVHAGQPPWCSMPTGRCRPTRQMVQQLMFFKNFAVVGGLLVLAAYGAGALERGCQAPGLTLARSEAGSDDQVLSRRCEQVLLWPTPTMPSMLSARLRITRCVPLIGMGRGARLAGSRAAPWGLR
jgi:putative oxidoreductase